MKLQFFILVLIFGFSSQAQTVVRASIAPDFTMVSMDNDTFNLYTELDAGKIVVLDFFQTGCPSCQQNTPKLDSVWQAYGYYGDSLWVWGIECSFGDSNYVQHINDFEANYGGQFPIFSTFQNTDSVLTLYGITWNPQYYLICPDSKIKQPRMEITEVDSVIQACQQILASINSRPKETPPVVYLSNNYLRITNLTNNPFTISIYNLLGQNVFMQHIQSAGQETTVSVLGLRQGVYFVLLSDGKKNYSSKIFIGK